MKNSIKLDQLTSLRFFAALLIVVHHSSGLFGIKASSFALDQAVSFFFVLSGFILYYVYPRLDSKLKIIQFWRARFARIWPGYLISFLIGYWLLSYYIDGLTLAAFITMTQAWFPMSAYYFSYNAVSWSISTEFFFYLAFPFILYKWEKTWLIKLGLSATLIIVLAIIANTLQLPIYGGPDSPDGFRATQHGLLYINPLARIFEFIFGVFIATIWKKRQKLASQNAYIATLLEIGVLILCAISLYYSSYWAEWSSVPLLEPSISQWSLHSGSVFVFGLLVFTMAQGRGIISRILSHPFPVLLGEISFSVYLLHQIFSNYYRLNVSRFIVLPDLLAFGIYLTIVLLASYLTWVYIEIPGRLLLIGKKKIHGSKNMKKQWHTHFKLDRKLLIDGVILCFLLSLIAVIIKDPNDKNVIKAFNNSNEVIYQLENGGLKFNPQVYIRENSTKYLKMKSIGPDPIINLPPLDLKPNTNYALNISIEVSMNTTLQIFYSDATLTGYPFSEERVITRSLKEGENQLYIILDYNQLGKALRLDPVTTRNIDIGISKLEIKEISNQNVATE